MMRRSFSSSGWVIPCARSCERVPHRALSQAIQVAPSFTYAHTLCGHELSAAGEHERALLSFRKALSLDSRHYRAW